MANISTQDSSSLINTTESDATSDSGMSGLQNSSNRDESSDNGEEMGSRLTLKWIYDFFKKDWKTYYRTLELNEKLYFHYKGRRQIYNYVFLQALAKLHAWSTSHTSSAFILREMQSNLLKVWRLTASWSVSTCMRIASERWNTFQTFVIWKFSTWQTTVSSGLKAFKGFNWTRCTLPATVLVGKVLRTSWVCLNALPLHVSTFKRTRSKTRTSCQRYSKKCQK